MDEVVNESVNSARKRRRSSSLQSGGTELTSCNGTRSGKTNPTGPLMSAKRLNPKANTACETCRLKKVKCNEGQPICGYCEKHGFNCDYRLKPLSSNEQSISTLLLRLTQVEEQLKSVLRSGQRPAYCHGEVVTIAAAPNTPITTPSSWSNSEPHFTLPSDPAQFSGFTESPVIVDVAPTSYEQLEPFAEEVVAKAQYLEKTPFECEDDRPPLSDFTVGCDLTQPSDIQPWLEYYLDHVFPMYPVMCDPSAHFISGIVAAQGFGNNIESCFTLFVIALSKAYQNEELNSGMADFQRATRILSNVNMQFKMRNIQAYLLSALFLLKKGRLLDFWSSLHLSCTMLYTMLKRDQASGHERSAPDRMNLRRIYWISYSLERDIKHEIDKSLPRSSLHELEDTLPLPVGCDEIDISHMPVRMRTMLTFFLAEMALKRIYERIAITHEQEFYIKDLSVGSKDSTPLFQELKRQLDEWVERVPSFLGWSAQSSKGVSSRIGIRVKLMYWFVRLSLYRPLIEHVVQDSTSLYPIHVWSLLREGIHAGLTLVNVSILEQSDIDVFMGNRIISAISLLKDAVGKGYFPEQRDESVNDILRAGTEVLWNQLARKSEWIKCRLYSLQ